MIRLAWRNVAPGDGPTISTSLTADETETLALLAAGGDVLEIGSAFGFSAVSMALAGAAVTAVDPHQWLNSYDAMVANLAAYGVSARVEIDRRDSWTVLPELYAAGRDFDLVWVDGDHEAATVAFDVAWARKLLRPGGTLACHDYDEATCPGVRQALDPWKPPPTLVDTLALYLPGEW